MEETKDILDLCRLNLMEENIQDVTETAIASKKEVQDFKDAIVISKKKVSTRIINSQKKPT